jgi:hypothetical protein
MVSAINQRTRSCQEIIGWMDGTCATACFEPAMLAQLKTCDVVIGSRYVPGAG